MPGPETAPKPTTLPRTATSALGDNWPTQATDAIVDLVDKVASKTTGPIQKLGRAIVYGTFALILGITALALFTILSIRLLNNYVVDHNIWAAYLILGVIFVGVAMWLWSWSRRDATAAEA